METEVKTVAADALNPTGNSKPSESTGEVASKDNLVAENSRLYFKGMVSEKKTNKKTSELLTGYGVAMCDHKDKLLFQMKGSLQETEITSFEAEVMTLKLGLTEAQASGIKHISIYTDCYPLYAVLNEGVILPQPKLAMLMDDVQRIREQFESNKVYLVSGNDIKFVYGLASASMVSEISIPSNPPHTQIAARKTVCSICFDEINVNQMFFITGCADSFCRECMKQHIEAKLSEGMVLNCPRHLCKTKLTLKSCESLLTPKLRTMWEQRLIENSIPTMQRVYCPYPKCSALMSKTDISEAGLKRSCIRCGEPFCINCKVPWHNDLSCNDYIRLHPNPDDAKLQHLANQRRWRQCDRCGHMIGVSSGCSAVTCRCGHSFCYLCGVELRHGHAPCPNHPHLHVMNGNAPPPELPRCCCYCYGVMGIIVCVLWLFIGFHDHYF